MATGKIAQSLEKLINNSSKQLGTLQIGINKILWGSGNTQPKQTVKFVSAVSGSVATGSLQYNSDIPKASTGTTAGNIPGLIRTLDVLNEVNLCDVITYATDNISVKKKKRPAPPYEGPNAALYAIQDKAALVVYAIDKYIAYPNVLIGTFLESNLAAVPPAPPSGSAQVPSGINTQDQAVSQSGAPAKTTDIVGTDVKRYNTYYLMQTVKEVFNFNNNSTGSLFNSEDQMLLATVPGLGANFNMLNNFIGTANSFSDYRQIPNGELQELQKQIQIVRSVCVTIQNLDFKNTLALAGNFLNIDIRSQIQQISKFLNPTQIIPTLKQVNSAVLAFIKIAKQVYGILTLGQFIIKLALLFNKIFKFIIAFFTKLPLPNTFTTAGISNTLSQATQKAKEETDGVTILLKAINALLAVVVVFIRYLLANTNEIYTRLQLLLTTLEGCEAVKESDVVKQLNQTLGSLKELQDQLAAYIISYDSKTDINTAVFGIYQIRVVDEQVTDLSIINKRRRGIALDTNGQIVAQSDLTFATNTSLIIAEVQQRLIAQGLIRPNLVSIDGSSLAVIADSLNYLENNDIAQEDLNLSITELDSPGNTDESQGLGLNAFVNNLPGGRKLRQRTRAALNASTQTLKTQLANEKLASSSTASSGSR